MLEEKHPRSPAKIVRLPPHSSFPIFSNESFLVSLSFSQLINFLPLLFHYFSLLSSPFSSSSIPPNPSFQTVSEVIVDVLDINDTPPKFEKDSYSEFVSENVPVGTVIAELRATDADTAANTDLTYSFHPKQAGRGLEFLT